MSPEPTGFDGANGCRALPSSKEEFCRELTRRVTLLERELAGLVEGAGRRAERGEGQLAREALRLLRVGRELGVEIDAALSSRDRPWDEARGRVERDWQRLRAEFEHLAARFDMRHAANPERGARGPRR